MDELVPLIVVVLILAVLFGLATFVAEVQPVKGLVTATARNCARAGVETLAAGRGLPQAQQTAIETALAGTAIDPQGLAVRAYTKTTEHTFIEYLSVLPALILGVVLILGLIYDASRVVTGVAAARNAADQAASEAAEFVDATTQAGRQELVLLPGAEEEARRVADGLTGGALHVEAVRIEGTLVIVEGSVCVQTPFLQASLRRPRCITRRVRGEAEAVTGVRQDDE